MSEDLKAKFRAAAAQRGLNSVSSFTACPSCNLESASLTDLQLPGSPSQAKDQLKAIKAQKAAMAAAVGMGGAPAGGLPAVRLRTRYGTSALPAKPAGRAWTLIPAPTAAAAAAAATTTAATAKARGGGGSVASAGIGRELLAGGLLPAAVQGKLSLTPTVPPRQAGSKSQRCVHRALCCSAPQTGVGPCFRPRSP
jgi:hypothetical protein